MRTINKKIFSARDWVKEGCATDEGFVAVDNNPHKFKDVNIVFTYNTVAILLLKEQTCYIQKQTSRTDTSEKIFYRNRRFLRSVCAKRFRFFVINLQCKE